MSTQLSDWCRTSLYRMMFCNRINNEERIVFVMADSQAAARTRTISLLAALFAIDPRAIHLYKLASFVELIETGVSDDEDLRIFELDWEGATVSVWVEHVLFLTNDASLLRKWTELYADIASATVAKASSPARS